MTKLGLRVLGLSILLGGLGCSDDDGSDPRVDAGEGAVDSGSPDLGGPDATPDAGLDARPDGGREDTGLDAGDAGDAGMSEPAACDPTVLPRRNGGAAGGPVDGDLHVFVVGLDDGAPLEGSTVVLVDENGEAGAETDARGCVRFRDPGPTGSYDVHVFTEGRTHESRLRQTGAVLSVTSTPPFGRFPETPITTVSGNVTNLDVIGPGSPTVARIGFVRQIPHAALLPNPPSVERSNVAGLEENVVLSGGASGLDVRDYTARADPSVAEGVFIQAGRLVEEPFVPSRVDLTHIGFVTDLDFGGPPITGQDLVLSHALDQTLEVTVPTDAADLGERRVWGLLSFPQNGQVLFGFADETEGDLTGDSASFSFPSRTGALSEARFGAVVAFETPDDVLPSLGTIRVVEGGSALGLAPPAPPPVHAPPSVDGRTFTFDAPEGSEQINFAVVVGDRVGWRVFAATDPESDDFTLPVPPEGFDDPLTGTAEVSSQIVDYEALDLADFDQDRALREVVTRTSRLGDAVAFETPDPNPFACTAATPEAVPGGGYTGGPIDGRLVIHTIDPNDGEPISNVELVIETPTGAITGTVDRTGCADIAQAGLVGPVDVHLYPTFGPFESFLGLTQTRQTFLLTQGLARGPAPNPATIEGSFSQSALDALPEITGDTGRVLQVLPVLEDTFAPASPETPVREDITFRRNIGVVAPQRGWDFRDYAIRVDADRAVGVLVRGGLFDFTRGTFEPTDVGVISNISATPGAVVSGRDFTSLSPLDQTQTVTVRGANFGAGTGAAVFSQLFFPGGGRITLETSSQRLDTYEFPVPAATGDFAGITYGAVVQRTARDGFNRYSLAVTPGTSSLATTVELSERPNITGRDGRRISATLPAAISDAVRLTVIVQQPNGQFSTGWRLVQPNPGTSTEIVFPTPPGGRLDPLRGTIFLALDAEGYAEGFDVDQTTGRADRVAVRLLAGDDDRLSP
jgi:hypothetical protein